jgi:protein tyrosine phosphatase (PTP) superfamily phosphohydrolase (DUF442 family)
LVRDHSIDREYDNGTMAVAPASLERNPRLTTGTNQRARLGLLIALLLVGAAAGGGWYWSEVVPGKLYRSGDISPAQLERVAHDLGIKRVISVLDPNVPESVAEREAAQRLGLRWENVPMRGNGESTPADRERILALLKEPDAPTTLVHCSAGTNRTGLAIGLYRIHCEGWTYEQVLEELKRYSFDDLDKHENMREALREAARSRTGK